MNPDELRTMLEDVLRQAIQPLEQELKALRLEVEALKNGALQQEALKPPSGTVSEVKENTVQNTSFSSAETNSASETHASSPPIQLPEVNTEIPAERTDFARFLQRGLEQEAHDYSEDNLREEEPKKRSGWNPFKR